MGTGTDSRGLLITKQRRRSKEQTTVKEAAAAESLTMPDTQRLLHELRVHQIELETQNAELRRVRNEMDVTLDNYTDLYDFAPVGYLTLDDSGCIRAANLRGASYLNVERSALFGMRFKQFVANNDRPFISYFLEKVRAGQTKETCDVSLMREGEDPCIVHIEAVSAASGQECRLSMIDISERKSLEEQLQQAQKMETFGLLARGIAHDFNQILNVIIDCSSRAEQSMNADDPQRDNLKSIIAAADRGANLSRSLLDFGRMHPINPQHVDINSIIEHVADFLRTVIGEDIRLETACHEGILQIIADNGQMEQVLINLATNARNAMPDGGLLSIVTEAVEIDHEFIRHFGFGEPGKYALIAVTDNGTGMDRETVRKIFEPFFTTSFKKKHGRRAGLGLSIVYSIIKQHNGFITVSSEMNKGSTFSMYLPLSSDSK